MSASDDVLRDFIQRVEILFDESGRSIKSLAAEVAQNNIGFRLALSKLDGVEESLGKHFAEMQRLRQTLTVVENGMLRLSADLQLTRESVAQQVTHEVDKKLDAHLSLVELADVAEAAAGNERQR